MSGEAAASEGAKAKGGKRKLLLFGLPLFLSLAGAGLWLSGVLPGLLGMKKPAAHVEGAAPVFVDLPEMLTNLNVTGKRPAYLKVHVKLEIPAADKEGVAAVTPRLVDLFQTYLRDMRPEELRGAVGTYRLREALLARANVAVAPAHVSDVLFDQLLIE